MYIDSVVKNVNPDGTVQICCSSEVCSSCKAGIFCPGKSVNEFCALNSDKISLSEGDRVELYLPPWKTVFTLLRIFVFPLLMFLIFFFSALKFFKFSEYLSALCGLCAVALSFFLMYFYSGRNRKKMMPVIVNKKGFSSVEDDSEE